MGPVARVNFAACNPPSYLFIVTIYLLEEQSGVCPVDLYVVRSHEKRPRSRPDGLVTQSLNWGEASPDMIQTLLVS